MSGQLYRALHMRVKIVIGLTAATTPISGEISFPFTFLLSFVEYKRVELHFTSDVNFQKKRVNDEQKTRKATK